MSTAISALTEEQLRDELRFAHAEYIQLRDQHQMTLQNRRAELEGARKAEQIDALRRAHSYALSILTQLITPLRTHLAAVGQLNDRMLPNELEAIAQQAQNLAHSLERDPDLVAAQRVLADMDAAHNQLTKEKAALWNTLQQVREAVRQKSLAELAEQEYRQ